jgi:hypothetical protein
MSDLVYVEKTCVFKCQGQCYEASGAAINESYCIAYLGESNVLTNWHGEPLGTFRITSTWKINCYLSSTMHQVEAVIDNRTYVGRSLGVGMIFRGRIKRRKCP